MTVAGRRKAEPPVPDQPEIRDEAVGGDVYTHSLAPENRARDTNDIEGELARDGGDEYEWEVESVEDPGGVGTEDGVDAYSWFDSNTIGMEQLGLMVSTPPGLLLMYSRLTRSIRLPQACGRPYLSGQVLA